MSTNAKSITAFNSTTWVIPFINTEYQNLRGLTYYLVEETVLLYKFMVHFVELYARRITLKPFTVLLLERLTHLYRITLRT